MKITLSYNEAVEFIQKNIHRDMDASNTTVEINFNSENVAKSNDSVTCKELAEKFHDMFVCDRNKKILLIKIFRDVFPSISLETAKIAIERGIIV